MALITMPSARMFRYEDAFTWSNKPSAVNNKDAIIRITNIGTNGSFFQSNGSRWVPIFGDVTLFSDAAGYSVTGTTNETELASITVPGGLMGPNGVIEIYHVCIYTNSANNKNIKIRIGGSSGVALSALTLTTTDNNAKIFWIRNANSTSAQKGPSSGLTSGVGSGTGAGVTSAVDTSASFDIVFSLQLANSGETGTHVGCRISYRE